MSFPTVNVRASRAAIWLFPLCVACTNDGAALSEGSFSALTYNVHGLPAEITGDDTPGRMVQIAPLLNDYDLLGVQEDFLSDNHEALLAEVDYPVQTWFSDILDSRVYPSGLSMLSRFEQVDYWTEHYVECNGIVDGSSDCLASKGFQVMRVALSEDVVLDVYNSHLEAGGGEEDNAARESQVEQLITAMNSYSAESAVLFLGDTNLSGYDSDDVPVMDRWLEETGLEDACDMIGCDEPGRIDRALVRSSENLQLEVAAWSVEPQFFDAEGTPLSDHDAIAVEIDWSVP